MRSLEVLEVGVGGAGLVSTAETTSFGVLVPLGTEGAAGFGAGVAGARSSSSKRPVQAVSTAPRLFKYSW